MDANINLRASPDAKLLAPLERPTPATLGPAPEIAFEEHLHETPASPKRPDPPPAKPAAAERAEAETFSGEADDGSTATAAASRESPRNENEAPAESDSPPDEERQEKDPAAVAAAPPTESPPAPPEERDSATEEDPSREIEKTSTAKAAPAAAVPPPPDDASREDAADEANSEPPRVERAGAPSERRPDGRVARQTAKDAVSQDRGDAGHPAVAEASLPPEESTDAASGEVRSVKAPRLKPEFATHDFAADTPGRDGAGAEAEQIAESEPESVRAQASARETAQGSDVAAADRVRLVQRVARAIESARPDGEVRLRIRPPELGSVHLRMKVEDGALVARIETETAHARSLLTEHLPELRERLAELDIRVERFEVEWREESGGRGDSSPQRDSQRREAPLSPAARANRGGAETPEPPAAPKVMRRTHSGDLDVLV